jgi:hypothetical protein
MDKSRATDEELAIDVNTDKSASFPFLQNPEAMAVAVLTFSSRPPPLRLVVERPCAAPRTRLASRRDPRPRWSGAAECGARPHRAAPRSPGLVYFAGEDRVCPIDLFYQLRSVR